MTKKTGNVGSIMANEALQAAIRLDFDYRPFVPICPACRKEMLGIVLYNANADGWYCPPGCEPWGKGLNNVR